MDTEALQELDSQAAKRRRPILTSIAIAVLLASFGVWVYGFGPWARTERMDLATGQMRRDGADLFDSSATADAAEGICADASQGVSFIPKSNLATDLSDRAGQIESATAIYKEMVAKLKRLTGSTTREAEILAGWVSDWDTVLEDRKRYAKRIATGHDEPYIMTDTGSRERLDKRLNRLAGINSMTSCVFPTDVG